MLDDCLSIDIVARRYARLEFTEWKSTFEQSSGSKYVKNCGSKGKSENQTTEYYYCNRTGPCKSSRFCSSSSCLHVLFCSRSDKQTRQGWRRNSKALDSLRCGIHCTSSMKVDISRNDQISVQYYPAHLWPYSRTTLCKRLQAQLPTELQLTLQSMVNQFNKRQSNNKRFRPFKLLYMQLFNSRHRPQPTPTTTDHCVRPSTSTPRTNVEYHYQYSACKHLTSFFTRLCAP